MTEEAKRDVNNMKMWVFRLAQKKWGLTSKACAVFFRDNKLFDLISDGYDYLHLMGYHSVVTELEEVLESRKVKVSGRA